jgi:hypothetical protein
MDFRQAAEAFCAVIDDRRDEDPRSFARRARNGVAGVYLAAANLPRTGFSVDDLRRVSEANRSADIDTAIRELVGADETFVGGALMEIYDDLKEALRLLDTSPEAGAREIGVRFESHWSRYAIEVLRPLHRLAVSG